MTEPIRAVIWDMGGVLLRTEDRLPRQQLTERYGLTYDELNWLVFGNPTAQLCEAGRANPEDRWGFISRKLQLSKIETDEFQRSFWAGDRLDLYLISFIESLRPHYKTGLLSNAGPDASLILQEKYPRLLNPFDVRVFSGEVKLVKPDPAIYHHILDLLAIKPNQAIFIDDAKQNIHSAQMVGFQTIWFRSAEQTHNDLVTMLGKH